MSLIARFPAGKMKCTYMEERRLSILFLFIDLFNCKHVVLRTSSDDDLDRRSGRVTAVCRGSSRSGHHRIHSAMLLYITTYWTCT